MKDNKSLWQAVKFTLFSISAGIIQVGSFAVLEIFIQTYWIPYLVCTPVSTYLGSMAEKQGCHDFLILAVTMLSNFVLEFLFCKFVVYRGSEDTI